MRTFGLGDAAQFLRVHPEELRRRAKAGQIPGAKIGRAWVFLEDDLASYLRSLYRPSRQALQVTTLNKEGKCHFASVAVSGGSTSLVQGDNEYADLLGLPTSASRRSSTIS
jgi:Helix-turn-helix domain